MQPKKWIVTRHAAYWAAACENYRCLITGEFVEDFSSKWPEAMNAVLDVARPDFRFRLQALPKSALEDKPGE